MTLARRSLQLCGNIWMITAWRLRGTSQPPSDEHDPVKMAHDLHYSHIRRRCQVQMSYSGTCQARQGLEEVHKKAPDKGEVGPKGPGDRPFMYPDKKAYLLPSL